MKFDVSDLKKFINSGKKSKRNVVHRIGYDKFSVKDVTKNIVQHVKNSEIREKIKDLSKSVGKLIKK